MLILSGMEDEFLVKYVGEPITIALVVLHCDMREWGINLLSSRATNHDCTGRTSMAVRSQKPQRVMQPDKSEQGASVWSPWLRSGIEPIGSQ